jgi:hypothetical protein
VDVQMQQSARSLFTQLPHDWVVCCDFEGAELHEGVFASEGEVSGWTKRKGYRLQPARHFAGALLEGFKTTSVSPHGLMFERLFERDGLQVKEIERRVTAAIPLGHSVKPEEQSWQPRFLAGLDLGEAGLGVCLRNLAIGAEQTLLLKTRKTFKLARGQAHYRNKTQPRQGFRKGYSQSMEFAIDAAMGEVCGLIDNLMVKYDAVPVFESQAAQARGSNKMVARVYAGVLQHYIYVNGNQAAQAVRQSHWLGAGRWNYSYGVDVLPVARQLPAKKLENAKVDAVFISHLGAAD